jgi:hypothetical protein
MGEGLLVGLLDDLDFHVGHLSTEREWTDGLRPGLDHLFNDPRATAVGEGLLVGLLDDLDFHAGVLVMIVGDGAAASAPVQRRCSTATSTSHGRSVPFFLSASFLSLFITALFRVTG